MLPTGATCTCGREDGDDHTHFALWRTDGGNWAVGRTDMWKSGRGYWIGSGGSQSTRYFTVEAQARAYLDAVSGAVS